MGRSDTGGKTGMCKSNGSTGSQTGSGYSTDVSDDNLPHDAMSPASDANEHSDSDDQVTYWEMLSMLMWSGKTKCIPIPSSDFSVDIWIPNGAYECCSLLQRWAPHHLLSDFPEVAKHMKAFLAQMTLTSNYLLCEGKINSL